MFACLVERERKMETEALVGYFGWLSPSSPFGSHTHILPKKDCSVNSIPLLRLLTPKFLSGFISRLELCSE